MKGGGGDSSSTQIPYCILAIEEGNPAFVEKPMTDLAAKSPKPSPGVEAWRILALSWLFRGDLAKARSAADRSVALARTSPDIADYLIPASILSARIDAAEGHTTHANAALNTLLRDAKRITNGSLQFDIRLATLQIAPRPGRSAESRQAILALSRQASEAGFGLAAQKAQALLQQTS